MASGENSDDGRMPDMVSGIWTTLDVSKGFFLILWILAQHVLF